MNWIKINIDDDNTYPKEGIIVLISDGVNYDTAYYLRSSSYYWLKVSVKKDTVTKFKDFEIIKWAYINENK